MKKRVVAVLLSLTMCSAMVAETGAAAIAEPSAAVVSEDVFSDEASSQSATRDPDGSLSGISDRSAVAIDGGLCTGRRAEQDMGNGV